MSYSLQRDGRARDNSKEPSASCETRSEQQQQQQHSESVLASQSSRQLSFIH